MRNKRAMKRTSQRSKDHLVSQKEWWTWCEDNLDWKRVNSHRGKHSYLWNKLFHKQLLQIIDENKTTLLPEALQVMDELKQAIAILMQDEKMYKKSCFKYWKYPKS